MACLEALPGESFFTLIRTAQLRFAALHLSKPQEEKQFGWWKGDYLGLFCSHKTQAPCSHQVNCELLCVPNYSRVNCEGICLAAKTWVIKNRAVISTQYEIYSRVAEKQKNPDAEMSESKSRETLGELFMNKYLQTSMNRSNASAVGLIFYLINMYLFICGCNVLT